MAVKRPAMDGIVKHTSIDTYRNMPRSEGKYGRKHPLMVIRWEKMILIRNLTQKFYNIPLVSIN